MMAFSILLLRWIAIGLLIMAIVTSSSSPYLPNTQGREWKMVGSLDMTDPTQQCPDSWQKITSPRSSCGKKSTAPCDSLNISTSGAIYQKVCGRIRGYQIGSPDAFRNTIPRSIETYYVDGITITYGLPGNRHHVYTFAVSVTELNYSTGSCPCTGVGTSPPLLVGSDYYCESGNPEPGLAGTHFYSSDVLWDRQQCGGNESTCCNPPDLPWFCKTFPTPISEDLEVRICTDQELDNENVAVESFELYIQVIIPSMNIEATSVFNSGNILHHLEISWIPVGSNETAYIVTVASTDTSVGQGCTICTTSPCHYVHLITNVANNYSISVASLHQDGSLGSQNNITIYSPTNSVFQNISLMSRNNSIGCSFLNNESFYCTVCCSTDPSVSPDSSVYIISTTRGTEVSVFLQGLTSGQMYHCKAAASSTNSTRCTGPVVGDIKVYFRFVTSIPAMLPTVSNNMFLASIDTYTIIGINIVISFVVSFSLSVLVTTSIVCVVKRRANVIRHDPALESSAEETIRNDQIVKKASFKVEANSAYGIAGHKEPTRQSDYLYI